MPDNLADIAHGFTNLLLGGNKEIATVRLAICKQCKHYKLFLCTASCNCVMPAKATLKVKQCPKGKW